MNLLWSLCALVVLLNCGSCENVRTALRKSHNVNGVVCLQVRRPNFKGRRNTNENRGISFRARNNDKALDHIPSNNTITFPSNNTKPNRPKTYPLLRPVKRKPFVEVSMLVKGINLEMKYLAGWSQVNSSWLGAGMHKLEYRHEVLDHKHNLVVQLDGETVPFTLSQAREPKAEFFEPSQVWIKLQGPVTFANRTCLGPHMTNRHPALSDNVAVTENPSEVVIETEAPPLNDQPQRPTRNQNILDDVNLRNETINQKIILNSRVYNSNISYSYIQNSKLYGNIVMNSMILDSVLLNTTAYNCTLKNTTLQHSEVLNGTYNDEYFIALNDAVTSTTNNSINIAFLIFGIVGIIILVLVVGLGSSFTARYFIKRRKDRLLVRSAVMGDIRSW